MATWTNYLVFDILGDLCFGNSMQMKEPGENELKAVPYMIVTSSTLHYPIANSPFTKLWVWLKPRGLDSLFGVLLPRALKNSPNDQKRARKDIFHYLFQAKDPETSLSAYTPEDLLTEARLLILAGTDTSTTTLAGTIFNIIRNPRVYARLVQEIRTTFQTVDEIRSGTKLSACRYLRTCLDETMRMSLPVSGDLTREVFPGGLDVDGIFVPEGTTGRYSLHHNENIFPDPFVYRPERCIMDEKGGVSAADVAHTESAFSPFSFGSRACLGKILAYLQLTIALARLLYLLNVKVPDGNTIGQGAPDLMWGRRNKNKFQVTDFLITGKQGPWNNLKGDKLELFDHE
ncbi:hypothetical protein MMC29_001763 [Sticta canariensis]|nr:hypothetical protein [Sticta canariensis]